jgi:hypothetical protein
MTEHITCEGCAQPDHCRVNGCFGEKARGVRFTSTYGQEVKSREKVLDGDLDAYARLRKDGVQPPSTDGARKYEAQLS